MSVLIPWSGGIDSTYLLYSKLRDGIDVRTFYVRVGNNVVKTRHELRARRRLARTIKVMNLPGKWLSDSWRFNSSLVDGAALIHGPQTLIWLLHAAMNLKEDVQTVSIAFSVGDGAVYYTRDAEAVWGAYGGFFSGNAKLEFPLLKWLRTDIVRRLPVDLLKDVWYCENPSPSEKPCGKCDKCVNHRHLTRPRP